MQRPVVYISQILAWADAYYESTGRWPKQHSGRIAGPLDEKWLNIDMALRVGLRGLPGGSSLARLLEEWRGVRNHLHLPPLTVTKILAWADAHFRQTGLWPAKDSGPIGAAPAETWGGANMALQRGLRGLPGGSSLARLLAEQRGVRNQADLAPLTQKRILLWADAHQRRTGIWPNLYSGPVLDAPGETWSSVASALSHGQRGLPGGSSLARLLARHRGVRNHKDRPRLTLARILAWADSHWRRTERWPTRHSGPIAEAQEETWAAVEAALDQGGRGLPGGSSLRQLFADRRGARHHLQLPRLVPKRILAWARAYYQRTGRWPNRGSGPITAVPGETWSGVDSALKKGSRGLASGSSLSQLLRKVNAASGLSGNC